MSGQAAKLVEEFQSSNNLRVKSLARTKYLTPGLGYVFPVWRFVSG
jgi:hypothetical protein